ncbi:MAG TPA: hypothetical protein VJQ81_05765 [Reyranella sp.]|nr:hypothetical protein [Reyranella sp.]
MDRTERVAPPPEAAQHYRPWPMQALLIAGHPDGIDADEFEAALQIVETFKALVAEVGTKALLIDGERIAAGHHHAMSDRDAERIACWFEWSAHLPLGLPTRLVAWIEDELPMGPVEVLRRACRLWDRIRRDRAKPPVAALDTMAPHMLTIPRRDLCRNETIARPVNRLVQPFSTPVGLPPFPIPSNPAGVELRAAMPRPVAQPSHAHASADPSTRRLRR